VYIISNITYFETTYCVPLKTYELGGVEMSLEAIKSIGETEESSRQAKLAAQALAKNMIAEAEKKGQAAVAAAVSRAEEDVRKLLNEADQRAADMAAGLQKTAAEMQAEIRRQSESRLDEVAGIIVERIVNG
jgi:vacuolar-type H+-ATPase subunit H